MTPTKLNPLTPAEAQAARDFFDGPKEAERLNRFVGWMVKSGQFSGKVADEIRAFQKCYGERSGK